MLRPMIQAPRFSNDRAAKSLSTPVVPPSRLCTYRWKVRVGTNHWCRCSPPRPRGWSRPWSGPAPKPSADTVKAFTRSLDTGVSLIVAAWTQDLQVEQDLIISRALVANLAHHGRAKTRQPCDVPSRHGRRSAIRTGT